MIRRTRYITHIQKVVLILCLLLYYSNTYSQISEGGTPPSFKYPSELKHMIAPISVPIDFSVEDMKKADEWQYQRGTSPLKTAYCIPVSLSLLDDGIHQTLPNGERITTLHIEAKDAIALIISYQQFYIPEGGKLYIYNAEKTQVLGAYTEKTNPTGDIFSTKFTAGDQVILEYVHSKTSTEKVRINISNIGYGYNNLSIDLTPGRSGRCMVDINCPEGLDWQTEKKGVIQLNQKVGRYWLICSASLVNNTAEDYTPYILTAYHCSDYRGSKASSDDYKEWQFNFNYEKEGCQGVNPPLPEVNTLIGCTKIAESPLNGGSDGLLLKLNQDIPKEFNPYFNGWDRSNTPANKGVGIHHPSGDYKKISTYTTPAEHATFSDGQSIGKANAFWNITFRKTENGHAVTEGGSSGSPIFDENHLITGTLTGGASSCSSPEGTNLYGKLYYHWDVMAKYLDPKGNGQSTSLNGIFLEASNPAPRNLTYSLEQNLLHLSWEAPLKVIPESYIVSINDKEFSTTATSYSTELQEEGTYLISIKAIYKDGESQAIWTSVFYNEPKAVENLEIKKIDKTALKLSWLAPEFKQNIHWGGETMAEMIGLNDRNEIYVAHLWGKSYLQSIAGGSIKGITFYGLKGYTYQVIIKEGAKEHIENIEPTEEGLLDFTLSSPLTISGQDNLFIIIKVTNKLKDEVYFALSNGKAENKKGNLISTDGITWEALDIEKSDHNFHIIATISSHSGSAMKHSFISSSSDQLIDEGLIANKNAALTKALSVSFNQTSTININNLPAAFPKIEGYKVYKNDIEIASIEPSSTSYVDREGGKGSIDYAVTVLYPHFESKPVVINSNDITSSKPSIHPIAFTDEITILNYEVIKQINIYSADSRLIKTVKSPGNKLTTSDLPRGIYIFHFNTNEGKKSTIKGIKY